MEFDCTKLPWFHSSTIFLSKPNLFGNFQFGLEYLIFGNGYHIRPLLSSHHSLHRLPLLLCGAPDKVVHNTQHITTEGAGGQVPQNLRFCNIFGINLGIVIQQKSSGVSIMIVPVLSVSLIIYPSAKNNHNIVSC